MEKQLMIFDPIEHKIHNSFQPLFNLPEEIRYLFYEILYTDNQALCRFKQSSKQLNNEINDYINYKVNTAVKHNLNIKKESIIYAGEDVRKIIFSYIYNHLPSNIISGGFQECNRLDSRDILSLKKTCKMFYNDLYEFTQCKICWNIHRRQDNCGGMFSILISSINFLRIMSGSCVLRYT